MAGISAPSAQPDIARSAADWVVELLEARCGPRSHRNVRGVGYRSRLADRLHGWDACASYIRDGIRVASSSGW
jgi:hypothetical protein